MNKHLTALAIGIAAILTVTQAQANPYCGYYPPCNPMPCNQYCGTAVQNTQNVQNNTININIQNNNFGRPRRRSCWYRNRYRPYRRPQSLRRTRIRETHEYYEKHTYERDTIRRRPYRRY